MPLFFVFAKSCFSHDMAHIVFCLFQMVDLPCIVESLKTVDMKTFYKTADICQVSYQYFCLNEEG